MLTDYGKIIIIVRCNGHVSLSNALLLTEKPKNGEFDFSINHGYAFDTHISTFLDPEIGDFSSEPVG